jgi:hypothetical protein
MKYLRKYNEEFMDFFKKKKRKESSYDFNHRSEEYRGFKLNQSTFPEDWKYDPEWAGKTRYQIWTIPSDIGPAYEGEGDIEAAKKFLDSELK